MTIQSSYTDLVETMRDLGAALIPATAARYDAPPGALATREPDHRGIKNPTLDVVLDPRRVAISSAIDDADRALRAARAQIDPHREALRQAVARWEGSETSP